MFYMSFFNQNSRPNNRNTDRDNRDYFDRRGEERRMFPAVCAQCNRDCQVPFQPDGSKPILCSNCYGKSQGGFENKRPSYNNDRRPTLYDRNPQPKVFEQNPKQVSNQTNELLVSINAKLEKILNLMSGTVSPKAPKEIKEILSDLPEAVAPKKVTKKKKTVVAEVVDQ